MINIFRTNRRCTITNSWLIISCMMLAIAVSSCTPSAVRTANQYKTKKNDIAREKESPKKSISPEEKIKEFEEKVVNNTTSPKKLISASEPEVLNNQNDKRLPTLREQLLALAEDNVVIKNKVNTLQNDVVEIKYTLEEIKAALNKSNILAKKPVVTGPESVDVEEVDEVIQSDAADPNVLLPDESVKKEVVKVKPAKKPAPVKSPVAAPVAKPKTVTPRAIASEKPKIIEKVEDEKVEQKTVLTDALNEFSKKQYNESINKLNTILSSTKDHVVVSEANYWLAENQMALSNYERAIEHYSVVIKSKNTEKKDDATAKMAECLLKTGQTNEAISAYKTLIDKYPKSEFVPKARKLLQQM